MTRTLISFLGKAIRKDGKPGYQNVTYLFADGIEHEDAFFGRALARHMKPQRILLLGTAGSMWDVLAESLGTDASEEWMAVAESAESNAVTQEQLNALAPSVSERMGCPCNLRIIPYARTDAEQVAILKEISMHCERGDSATIDITHGFRTLPMLGLLAALFLQRARNVAINGIYYGALDMRGADGRVPVQQLDGMLQVASWIQSLASFDESGNFGVFCDLLARDGLPAEPVAHLRRAAFHERTFNINDATNDLIQLTQSMPSPLPGVGQLFEEELSERIGWHRKKSLYARQRHLAQVYLERRDWVRCTIFSFEAFISNLLDDYELAKGNHYDIRENARKDFEEGKRGSQLLRDDYFALRSIRNYLAHGSVSTADENNSPKRISEREEILKTIKNEDRLAERLQSLIRKLLPK